MNISNSLSLVLLNSIQLINSEHLVLKTLLYHINPLLQVLCQLSSLTILYPNIVWNSYPLPLLVPMSDKCRPLSYQNVLCRLHSSPFIKKCILLEMCLVCLVSLPLLSIHTSDLLSNIMRGAYCGNTYVSLSTNLIIIILNFASAVYPSMTEST